MSNVHKSLNDTAWEQLFAKYDTLKQLTAGAFYLIKPWHELPALR